MLTLPFTLAIALAIKADTPGPVLFRGKRVGKDGEEFEILKFRTMVDRPSLVGPAITGGNDPRITKVGRFIRRYKFDELPQLVNVLKGDMSFVGPRPEVKIYTDMYTEKEKVLLELRPGITDWASIWNNDEAAVLAGHEDPERAYLELIRPEKIRLQLEYYNKRSFVTDIKIIGQTIGTLLGTRT